MKSRMKHLKHFGWLFAALCLTACQQADEGWLQESLGVFNEETLELYRGLLDNHVIPAFGDRKTVSREEILAFREEKLAQGISESTAYTMVRVLGRILEYGASIGECPAPDWDLGLGTPKRSRGVAILTPTEERQVCSYLIENPTPMHLCTGFLPAPCRNKRGRSSHPVKAPGQRS